MKGETCLRRRGQRPLIRSRLRALREADLQHLPGKLRSGLAVPRRQALAFFFSAERDDVDAMPVHALCRVLRKVLVGRCGEAVQISRSEERRVGKGRGSRWAPARLEEDGKA